MEDKIPAIENSPTRETPAHQRFLDLVSAAAFADFPPNNPSERKALNEMFWHNLLGSERPRYPSPKNTPAAKFFSELLHGNLEILSTFFVTSNTRSYFGIVPRGAYGKSEYRRSEYLAFIVHAYLNELYILEQRMTAYPKKVARAAAKGSEMRTAIEKIAPLLSEYVAGAFKPIRVARDSHVHKERVNDDGIGRLGTFELLVRFRGSFLPPHALTLFDAPHRAELRRVKDDWDKKFRTNEAAIRHLMELYYAALLKAVFRGSGALRRFL